MISTILIIYIVLGLFSAVLLIVRELDRGNNISLGLLFFMVSISVVLWPLALVLEFNDVVVLKGKRK